MKMQLKALGLVLLAVLLVASPALAGEMEFFGTAKFKPTFYSNFDFDSNRADKPALNEGGWASGEHIRSELRFGWKAKGDNWRVKMIAEADVIMEKDTADRSFYVGAVKENQPNSGGEFGIERAEMGYTFNEALDLSAGWDIRYLDLKSGGLLYGDDHPFIGLRGALGESTQYQLLYLTVQNRDQINVSDSPSTDDWRAYTLKVDQTIKFGNSSVTLSPLVAFSDNTARNIGVTYFGLESLGNFGPVNYAFEVIGASGDFRGGSPKSVSSSALYAGAEMPINKMFKPYVALRYTQGDADKNDNDVEGFVGITDIGRFSPLMGMDGNILGEHLASGASPYGASLYAYAPERAVGGDGYGGIGNGGSGNNPGQKLIAFGTKGAFASNWSYKAQAFFIWYDETGNLPNPDNPGQKVDDYAGTTFDLQAKYKFSKNFAIDYIFSTFVPGDGIKDQADTANGIKYDDNAYVNMLTLAWTY